MKGWLALAALAYAGHRALRPESAALDRNLPAFLRDEARRALQRRPVEVASLLASWRAAELPVRNPSLAVHRGDLWLAGEDDGWRLLELGPDLKLQSLQPLEIAAPSLRLCSWQGQLLGLAPGRAIDLATRAEFPIGPGMPLVQGTRMRYLRGLDPVRITGREPSTPRLKLDHVEPSTQVIRFGPGWLTVAREAALHRFVYLGDRVRVSPPFALGDSCHGLSRHPGQAALLLSFEQGNRGFLGRVGTRCVAEALELCSPQATQAGSAPTSSAKSGQVSSNSE